jgi:hypothetical protein
VTLQGAAIGAQVAAAITAALLAVRRPAHRPAAVALSVLVASVVGELPILAALAPLPRPVEGPARVLVYLDGAALLAGAAVVPGLAFAVCMERPRRVAVAIVAAWAVASIVLAALYPSPVVRGASLARIYLAADLTGLAASAVAFALWRRVKRSPSSAHVVALILVFLDLAVLINPLGPWRAGLFGVPFDPVQATILVGFAAVALYQGVLWRFSSRSP